MRKSWLAVRIVQAAALAAALLMVAAPPVLAHEQRTVGSYQFTVGWLHEPAYTDEQNAVQFLLADARGNPVTDLGDTLKVEVIFGNQKMTPLALDATLDPDTGLGKPGEYLASLIPTQPGKYTFHFTGGIKGQQVDQSFTSGPNTFDEVKDPTGVEFPGQDPTRAQLAQRIQRLDPRIAAVQSAAQADVQTVRIVAMVALGLAVLALIGVSVALLRRPGGRGL